MRFGSMQYREQYDRVKEAEERRVRCAEGMSSGSSLRSTSFFVSIGVRKRERETDICGGEWICAAID